MTKKESPTQLVEGRAADYISLAGQLRELVSRSGKTINGLAVDSGVPQAVLQRFVMGHRENIRLDTADKLCEYFGVRLTTTKRKTVSK